MSWSRLLLAVAITIPAVVACSLLVGDPHPAPNPTCCDPACPSIATEGAVYVSPDGSGSACTSDAACGSIVAAIQKLNGFGVVLMASGAYAETVDLGNTTSIALCGGYDEANGWRRTNAPTTLTGTEARTIDNAVGPSCVIVDGVEVRTRSANPGETVYGVFAWRDGGVATMCLRDVILNVAAGGVGDAGAIGLAGGSTACSAGGSGQNGNDGDDGAATDAAGFTINGVFQSQDGQNGSAGDPGAPGTFLSAVCYDDPDSFCTSKSVTCKQACIQDAAVPCNSGQPSCGGGGGGAGLGGGGGGASIGLVAVHVHVSARRLKVTTESGGAGGLGGGGGAGGDATAGMPEQCLVCTRTTLAFPPNYCSVVDAGVPVDAAIVGLGGHGGHGGAGGGGAGGWSCGLVLDENTSVAEILDASTIDVGAPGVGASGAPDGKAMRICFVDGGGIE